ncbi:ABC-F family ATP-binding cassette domain-containing protein [Kroppenstedtia eburnea]|uniref:ABC-F family ATP-binding cassette domain-containing protein n=1 Tax=Kroppenstedtia eburnea TaxID=714067 RepID=UPI0036344006
MSLIHVENLTHRFGDRTILDRVGFRLLPGEHAGLVGPNGVGKTTFLQILAGTLLPDEGRMDRLPRMRVGVLDQHLNLKRGQSIRSFLKTAFADLYEAETELEKVTQKMGKAEGEELERLFKRYTLLLEQLERGDFYTIDSRVEETAAGLGLTSLGLETDVSRLSGGQRTKLLLAKLLLQQPDLLLLDEPTNYLDPAHIDWLAETLRNSPGAFLLVSHDREFMDRTAEVIFHLEHRRITRYPGNYTQFLAASELRKQQVHQAYRQQQEEVKRLEDYIRRNKARASTARQAKSREKRLERMERIDPPHSSPPPRFAFSVAIEPVTMVLETKGLTVGYGKPLYPAVDLQIKRGEKVALVGRNGVGKTTTLRTLLGEISPLSGQLRLGDRVKPAFFVQEEHAPSTHTAMDEVWAAFPHRTRKEIRQALARCGIRGEHLMQPLSSLSGGERSRVRLCKLMLTPANWLVLDEPTNHLDAAAKEALRDALRTYPGTVLLVSHESDFHEGWTDQVWDLEQWRKGVSS